jgi:hypothetical protein
MTPAEGGSAALFDGRTLRDVEERDARLPRRLVAAKQDTKPVEAEILVLAGILGHFVADGSQPLHVTALYNGWLGPNPHGYTTEKTIHARFESDYVHANIKASDVAPLVGWGEAGGAGRCIRGLCEVSAPLELVGGEGVPVGQGRAPSPARALRRGRAFTDERLAAGAIELRDMIYTAWVKSAVPIPPYRGN